MSTLSTRTLSTKRTVRWKATVQNRRPSASGSESRAEQLELGSTCEQTGNTSKKTFDLLGGEAPDQPSSLLAESLRRCSREVRCDLWRSHVILLGAVPRLTQC